MTTTVDRRRVLAYRPFAQGLHRDTDAAEDLGVVDLGVQDTPPGSANHALATRLASAPAQPIADAGLAATWSVRGAPHVHRADELVADPLAAFVRADPHGAIMAALADRMGETRFARWRMTGGRLPPNLDDALRRLDGHGGQRGTS